MSSTLTEEQTAENEARFGQRYVAIQSGDPLAPNRKQARRLAKKARSRAAKEANAPTAAGTIAVTSAAEARYTDFAVSLLGVASGSRAAIQWARGADIAANRNDLAQSMEGDWIWFLDDDHTFDHDLLDRLVSHDVDIVAPMVVKKVPPFLPVAVKGANDDPHSPYSTLLMS